MNLPAGATTSITGRVITGAGTIRAACAVAVTPNSEPAAIVQVASDGSFQLGPLNPGSYLVGLAGCDFSGEIPPGITDPTDPSVVYPLQWSSGTPLDFDNIWINPPWVTAASGTPTDLGTICLKPCNRTAPPTEPPTTAPPSPTAPTPTTAPPMPKPPAPNPPVVGPGETPFVQPDRTPVVVPETAPTPRASATEQAVQSIAPPPAPEGTVVSQVDVHGATVTRLPTVAPLTFTHKLAAPSPSGSGTWWWLFVAAAFVGLGAAAIPWYRRRRI